VQQVSPHLEESELEQYSMGALPPERVAQFEEHFLVCETCQDRLLEMEAYVNAIRSVSPKLRAAPKPRWPRRAWGFGAAALALAAALILVRTPSPRGKVTIVALEASRGIAGLSQTTAIAGRPLALQIDLTQIPASSSYRLEVVDALGKKEAESAVSPEGGSIVHRLEKGLPAGQHYVRLYRPSGELLREYGLVAGKN
jgi:hypothetical protein